MSKVFHNREVEKFMRLTTVPDNISKARSLIRELKQRIRGFEANISKTEIKALKNASIYSINQDMNMIEKIYNKYPELKEEQIGGRRHRTQRKRQTKRRTQRKH